MPYFVIILPYSVILKLLYCVIIFTLVCNSQKLRHFEIIPPYFAFSLAIKACINSKEEATIYQDKKLELENPVSKTNVKSHTTTSQIEILMAVAIS